MIMELMPPQPTADQSMQYLMASIFYTVIMYHLVPSFEIFTSCPIICIYVSEILIPDTSEFSQIVICSCERFLYHRMHIHSHRLLCIYLRRASCYIAHQER